MNCNMDCKDKCNGTCKKCKMQQPLYLDKQVAAPGETKLMDMRGIKIYDSSNTVKGWLDHDCDWYKKPIAEFKLEWYPAKVFENEADKDKLDAMQCYVLSPDEYATVCDVVNTFKPAFGLDFNFHNDPGSVSFEVKQFLGNMWAYNELDNARLDACFPKHANVTTDPLVWRAFRLYDIRYMVDTIRDGTEFALGYAGRVHGSTDRYLNKLKKAQEVLNNLQVSTVIIPYKGATSYGQIEENDGIQ